MRGGCWTATGLCGDHARDGVPLAVREVVRLDSTVPWSSFTA